MKTLRLLSFMVVALVSFALIYRFSTPSQGLSLPVDTREYTDKDRLLISLLNYVLDRLHYEPQKIDDDFSKRFMEEYLNELDYSKRYFLQTDIEEFKEYETNLDEQIQVHSIRFFDLSYERLSQRLRDVKSIYTKILAKPFDFEKEEYWSISEEDNTYSATPQELQDKWHKYLKYNTLTRLIEKIEAQEEMEESKRKGMDSLEIEARSELLENLTDWHNRIIKYKRKDWFGTYLSSMCHIYDPHTSYFAPREKKIFDMNISGKFEGIGARLTTRGGIIKVVEIIPGGPCWVQGKLENEDKILKVGQGKRGELVNVVGMLLDDAIELIKGKKGTTVRLQIQKPDGSKNVVEIVRDVVELAETFAKSSIITQENNKKVGYIYLPKFYVDFSNRNQRNAASDIGKEIDHLKKENIDGLILDLRNNSGGSLQACVDIAGYFIKDGPVVQVRSRQDDTEILEDTDSDIKYDGKLVILVNKLSASASEILAAALQDYKRAVVIGDDHTFGKGTVQNLIDLDNLVIDELKESTPLGSLKITTQKFYRINGKATQQQGVEPDIVLPGRYMYSDIGEKEEKYSLVWDETNDVTSDSELIIGDNTLKQIFENSKKRIDTNQHFRLISDRYKWIEENQNDSLVVLNLKKYQKYQDDYQKSLKRFEDKSPFVSTYDFRMNEFDKAMSISDTTLEKKRVAWHKRLKKDLYINEAINVLNDF